MAQLRMVYKYNGYPMSKAADVVKDNITGDEDWQENLIDNLSRFGVDATAVRCGEPFAQVPPEEFVAVCVPVTVDYTPSANGPTPRQLRDYCEEAIDWESGFFCDHCYWEECE